MYSKLSKFLGIIFSIIMIVFSIFWFGGNDIIAKQETVYDNLNNPVVGLSIMSQVNEILAQANNMVFVASRYEQNNDVNWLNMHIDNLDFIVRGNNLNLEAINIMGGHETTRVALLSTFTSNVVFHMSLLNANRDILNMTSEDEALFSSILANAISSYNILNRDGFFGNDGFNDIVKDMNTYFSSNAVASFIMRVRNIPPITDAWISYDVEFVDQGNNERITEIPPIILY